MGISLTDNRSDARIDALLPAASLAVRNYAGRSFEVTDNTSSARTYLYDGSGILDTDDFVALTGITTDYGVTGGPPYDLTADMYTAMPHEGPVYYWVIVRNPGLRPASPQMGFTRNLDTLDLSGTDVSVTVTAEWGWPSIPDDVKLATAWTIDAVINDPPDNMVSETIESFSRSWANVATANQMLAVPNRARDLLSAYQRVFA